MCKRLSITLFIAAPHINSYISIVQMNDGIIFAINKLLNTCKTITQKKTFQPSENRSETINKTKVILVLPSN